MKPCPKNTIAIHIKISTYNEARSIFPSLRIQGLSELLRNANITLKDNTIPYK